MTAFSGNTCTDSVATFTARTWVAHNYVDEGAAVAEADVDEYAGAELIETFVDQLKKINTLCNGTLSANALCCGGAVKADADASSDDLTVGLLSSAGDTGLSVLTTSSSSGRLSFGRTGVLLAGGLAYSHSTDALTIRANNGGRVAINSSGFDPSADNTYRLGSSSLDWTMVHSRGFAVYDGVTAPSTVTNHAAIYVDSASLMLSAKFADGSVAVVAHDIPSTNVALVDRETSDQAVVNTVTETTVLTYTVPANSLGTTGILRGTLVADFLNDTGSNQTFRLRLKLGATTLYDGTTVALATSTTRRPVSLQFWLANQGATNDQTGGAVFAYGRATASTVGLGDFSNAATGDGPLVFADGAVDTTSAQAIAVTIELSAASASLEFRKRLGFVEQIKG